MFSSLNPSKCTHTWSSGHGARGAVGGSQGGVVAGWCSRTIQENETEVGILVNHNLTWADVWGLCGNLKIRRNLQGVWNGQCTSINMVMPFKIIKGIAGDIKEELKQVKQLSRTKRAVTSPGGSFDNRLSTEAN